ncbi:LysM peptidoglycan-binding domain-containing protein [Sporolactobacillus shoreae]|uniref:LysM peptidoglycan-binding domain-containing protein n=1 Tax=Sporolactobacillus shoreae TaxID=1465501 RepID=A0A4Z0GL29_9BACL|nr:NlpC/P60 family protein [Sporolactobacillus shoreae]TGA97635.1 LysM peptidoglycan-binding domain-containing protein [Sporolactobacillus shoreae]
MKKPIIPVAIAGGVILSGIMNGHEAIAAVNPVDLAEHYIHTPYQWGQNDCSGFTKMVFAQLGINLPHSSVLQATYGIPVSKGNLKPGDLVFFNTSGRGISHVGIYVGGGWMISAESVETGVRETRVFGEGSASYWEQRFVTGRRLEGNTSSAKTYVRASKEEATMNVSLKKQKPEFQKTVNEDFEKETYTVAEGDTLSEISLRVHVSVLDLQSMNQLLSDAISPGQVIRIKSSPIAASSLSEKAWFLDLASHEDPSDHKIVRKIPVSSSVKKGEKTLWAILAQKGITVVKFQVLSQLAPVSLFPGQKLYFR